MEATSTFPLATKRIMEPRRKKLDIVRISRDVVPISLFYIHGKLACVKIT
jgi:hypothetical protein